MSSKSIDCFQGWSLAQLATMTSKVQENKYVLSAAKRN